MYQKHYFKEEGVSQTKTGYTPQKKKPKGRRVSKGSDWYQSKLEELIPSVYVLSPRR